MSLRITIKAHPITAPHCERCFPNALEQHRACYYILDEKEINDGSPIITLTLQSDAGNKIYSLTPEQVALMRTEGVETVLAEIDEYERNQPPGD